MENKKCDLLMPLLLLVLFFYPFSIDNKMMVLFVGVLARAVVELVDPFAKRMFLLLTK